MSGGSYLKGATRVVQAAALLMALAAMPAFATAQTGTESSSTNPPPEGDTSPPAAQLDALAAAIAQNGCIVSVDNQDKVLADAGLTPLEGANALDWLVRDKRVVTLGVNAFKLVEGCK